MPLTDTAIRNIKPQAKDLKQSDGGGLFLLTKPTGSKWWRLAYRFNGKQKTISLGTYPEITLAQARDRRDEARKLLAQGIDPSETRKAAKAAGAEKAANSFEVVAREWLAKQSKKWVCEQPRVEQLNASNPLLSAAS